MKYKAGQRSLQNQQGQLTSGAEANNQIVTGRDECRNHLGYHV